MSVQNINNTGISAGTPATSPAPLPASPTAPAAPAGETAQEVTGGNQPVKQEGAQSSPKAAGQPNTAAPAVLVDLESFLTTELAALSKLLSSRAAVVNKLPPEIKELVQNILKQTQPAQTALPDGLAALLKSSGTSAEKLVLLANALEEAAGLTAKPGEQPAAGLAAGKQQALQVLAKALNSGNPDELKAAAAILRELANTAESSGSQPAVRQNTAAGRQQIPAAVLQTGGLPVAQPGAVAVPAASGDVKGQQAMPAAASTGSTPAAEPQDLPPALSLPANQAHEQQDMNAGVTRPAAGQQPPAGLPLQPGRLPVETEEMVRMAPQTASQAEGEQEPAAALPTTIRQQTDAVVARQQYLSVKQSYIASTQQDPTVALLSKALAARPELLKKLPAEIKDLVQTILSKAEVPEQVANALPASLSALLKSAQPAAEKIIMLAAFLQEAAEVLPQAGRQAAPATVGGQQVLAEVIDSWQKKSQQEQKNIAAAIRELAESIAKPGSVMVERQERHNVLSFTVPLYFGDGQTAYPAHIHVYQQEEEDQKNPGQKAIETWLRIHLDTENIGTVETAFRLYDGQNLDVKVRFDDKEAAEGFADSVPAVRAQLEQLPLQLGEFLVR